MSKAIAVVMALAVVLFVVLAEGAIALVMLMVIEVDVAAAVMTKVVAATIAAAVMMKDDGGNGIGGNGVPT